MTAARTICSLPAPQAHLADFGPLRRKSEEKAEASEAANLNELTSARSTLSVSCA